MAGGTWDKLEQVFEDRVARALSKLGVYTQNDVERLAERVDALSEAVNELLKAAGGSRRRSRAGRAARRQRQRPRKDRRRRRKAARKPRSRRRRAKRAPK